MTTKYESELINGKPYFGIYFGTYLYARCGAFEGDKENNPMYQMAMNKLNEFLNIYSKFEIRNKQVINRPPSYYSALESYGTIGIKFLVWGRAFEVMKLVRKNVPVYKKKLVNGRRKLVKHAQKTRKFQHIRKT